MQSGELQVLRNTILNYLQDDTVRVSVLLKDKTQNHDGRFVISTNGPVAAGLWYKYWFYGIKPNISLEEKSIKNSIVSAR